MRNNLVRFMGLSTLLISGCTMAPEYTRPPLPVEDGWPDSLAQGEAQRPEQEITLVSWRAFVKSEVLRTLIEDALVHNRDLRLSVLNVEKTRAQYQIQWADLVPSVAATGSLSRKGTPKNVVGGGSVTSTYNATVGITSYELDLFGRVRSLTQSALETFLSTQEAQKAARISLIAQVAQGYVGYLAQRQIYEGLGQILKAQEEQMKVVQLRVTQGTASMLDLENAQGDLEATRALLATARAQMAQNKNALTLLVGKAISSKILEEEKLEDVFFEAHLPIGLPSQVLLARPDVMEAEHLLRAAGASIGAARAAFFPSISLTGTAGYASAKLSTLFDSGSTLAWSFVPQVQLPIFEGGRTVAGLEVAQVSEKMAVAQYEKAIQSAFREVADGLVNVKGGQDQDVAQKRREKAAWRAYDIAKMRYAQGVDTYTSVLLSQSSLINASLESVSAHVSYLNNLITLYKALGGGLDVDTDASASQKND